MPRAHIWAILALIIAASAAAKPAPALRGYRSWRDAAEAAADIASLSQNDKKDLWKQFKKDQGKSYKDGSSEDQARFNAFAANLDDMAQWNAQPGVRWFKGINEFSDLTFDQFASKMLMSGVSVAEVQARAASGTPFVPPSRRNGRKLAQAVPNEFDWRSSGKVPPPRDQGGCGSCWAFAGVGAMEIKAMIDGVMMSPDQSEQQAVDCVSSVNGYGSQGCNGGYSDEVLRYASKLFETTEKAYPYTSGSTGAATSCKVASTATAPAGSLKLSSFSYVASNPDAIMAALQTGPVITYFNVKSSFYGYTSGIYPASSCTTETINHAMIIVGYNKTAGVGSPDSYWIVRNSWGTWGDGGYIKVQMTNDNIGACRMYTGLMLPAATSTPSVCNCSAGQFCSGGACKACPAGCASCTSATTCMACLPGWTGSNCSTPSCGSSCAGNQYCGVFGGAPACLPCGPNCATCSGSSGCTTCAPGWTGAPACTIPSCGGSCASNQYCSIANNAATCANCPANCISCTSPTTCSKCAPGWKGADCSQPDCGTSCAANQFCTVVNGAPSCAACGANCATCSDANTCKTCLPGWTGAPSCTTPVCTTGFCPSGQYCSTDSGAAACSSCPANCVSCTSPSTCSKCAPGWKGADCSQPDCGTSCAANQFCTVVNGAPSCAACGASCATCSDANTCKTCLPGWTGAPACATPACTTGFCPSGQYCSTDSGAAACSSCPANCLTCTSASQCSLCTTGWTGTTCSTPNTCAAKGASCRNNSQCCSGWCNKKRCDNVKVRGGGKKN
ncbi:hypothetical protein ABPG77_004580 [Micractinium sp. CCAP 211/92]